MIIPTITAMAFPIPILTIVQTRVLGCSQSITMGYRQNPELFGGTVSGGVMAYASVDTGKAVAED